MFPRVDGLRSIEFGTPGASREHLVGLVLRFADVPDEFAVVEAEGDLDAADFRASHLAFWTGVGEHVTDDTPVVTVHFDLLPEIIRTLDR